MKIWKLREVIMSKQVKDISILECNDYKEYDMNTSLYLYEIESKTIDDVIDWKRKWNGNSLCFSYYGIYTNSKGIKVILELLDEEDFGISLECNYSNHNKSIKNLYVTDMNYSAELTDLLIAVKNYIKLQEKDYINNDYLTNPYYNRKNNYIVPYRNDNYKKSNLIATKVQTSRGKKAEKLLENVTFESNFQILGEITYIK